MLINQDENIFNADDLSRTDDERISQKQMFDLFTFVINVKLKRIQKHMLNVKKSQLNPI